MKRGVRENAVMNQAAAVQVSGLQFLMAGKFWEGVDRAILCQAVLFG